MLSNKKLLFVSEKGLFSKNYSLVFEMPYNKVDEIIRNKDQLTLNERKKRHEFKSYYAKSIESFIKDLKEPKISA